MNKFVKERDDLYCFNNCASMAIEDTQVMECLDLPMVAKATDGICPSEITKSHTVLLIHHNSL
jgi:hypothetical protein